MMPGETILSGAPQICDGMPDDPTMHPRDESGRPTTVDVLWDVYQSGAGFYIGTFCPHCGPNSRESNYFPTREDAERIYRTWLPFISDGKFDLAAYEDAPHALPYSR